MTATDVEVRPRRRTAPWIAAAVGVVLAVFVAVLATREPATTRVADSPLLGRQAPAITGESVLDGRAFDLDDEEGRFVLVNFFATWCTPCVNEHDDLLAFATRHQAADDARVVTVVFEQEEADEVRAFFEERGGNWPVIDAGSTAIVDYGVTGVPESYLVGPEGVVRTKILGGIDAQKLEDLFRRAASGVEVAE